MKHATPQKKVQGKRMEGGSATAGFFGHFGGEGDPRKKNEAGTKDTIRAVRLKYNLGCPALSPMGKYPGERPRGCGEQRGTTHRYAFSL